MPMERIGKFYGAMGDIVVALSFLLIITSAVNVVSSSPAESGDLVILRSYRQAIFADRLPPKTNSSDGSSYKADGDPNLIVNVISPAGKVRSSTVLPAFDPGATAISTDGKYSFTAGTTYKSTTLSLAVVYIADLSSKNSQVRTVTLPNARQCQWADLNPRGLMAVGGKNSDGSYDVYVGQDCRNGCKREGFFLQKQIIRMRYNPSGGKLTINGEPIWTDGYYGQCGDDSGRTSEPQTIALLDGKLYGVLAQYGGPKMREEDSGYNLIEFGKSTIGAFTTGNCDRFLEFAIASPTKFYGLCRDRLDLPGFLFTVSGTKYTRGSATAVYDNMRSYWDTITVQPGSRVLYAILREDGPEKYPFTNVNFTLSKLKADNVGYQKTPLVFQDRRRNTRFSPSSSPDASDLMYSYIGFVP